MKVIKMPRLFGRKEPVPKPAAAVGAAAEVAASTLQLEASDPPTPITTPARDEGGVREPPPLPDHAAPGKRRWVGPLQIGVVIALVGLAVALSRTPSATRPPAAGGLGAGSGKPRAPRHRRHAAGRIDNGRGRSDRNHRCA